MDRPLPIFPVDYTPSDLAFVVRVSFEAHDGRLSSLPEDALVAGTRGTWLIEIENRALDLGAGAAFGLVRMNGQIAYKLQTARRLGREYCTIETTGGAQLELVAGRSSVNLLSILVRDGAFCVGDRLTVRIGDRRWGSVGAEVFWSATDGQFLLAVDTDGSGQFLGIDGNPIRFRVVAHPAPSLLRLLGPTVAAVGERFPVHLGVFDRSRNLITSFQGRVDLKAPASVPGLPSACELTAGDEGRLVFEDVRIEAPGIYRIAARLAGDDRWFWGNPVVVQPKVKSRVYWGDVHAHGWGDFSMYLMHLRTAKLDPVGRHRQARDIGRLDFACPGPMSLDPARREEIWPVYQDACAQMDEPGRYVPFLSYEAHSQDGGDRQMIFRVWRGEPIPLPVRAPIREVDQTYGERDDVLMEVHIGGAPPRWHAYQPGRERFVEVCSAFGCAEWLLHRALQLGYRPAICGASDLHLGLMGGPRAVETFRGRFGYTYPMNQRDAGYGTGPLTAIWSEDLSRDALWSAIEGRQTYATSGARVHLDVEWNGLPAGSEVPVGDGVRLAGRCSACAPLDQVDLIVGERCVRTWRPGTSDLQIDVMLAPEQLPGRWAYLRIHQVDGEYAWSAPVWFSGEVGADGTAGRPWNESSERDLPPADPSAQQYLGDLVRYLQLEEDFERFEQITPVEILDLSVGRCALFCCYWGRERMPMSIRWFYEYEMPKIRYDFGWQDFGAYSELELSPRLREEYG